MRGGERGGEECLGVEESRFRYFLRGGCDGCGRADKLLTSPSNTYILFFHTVVLLGLAN